MIPIDRTRVDQHLLAARYLAQQFPTAMPYISRQYLVPILRRSYDMVFAIPYRVAATLIVLHIMQNYLSIA